MISFFDADGRLMLVNSEWERTRGWTLKEIQEQNLDILAESYPDPKELQRARDFLTASTGEWADFKITVKDGEVIDTTWAAARLSDATCVAIGQNITERKRADENLSRLAAIVECSDTAIISQTLDGNITSWNHGAERIYGYSESEVIGQSISIIAPKDRLEEFSLFLDKIRCGERVEHFETVRQTKDGRLIDISLTISAIRNKTGQIVGASSIASDVTERKRTEEALRQSGEQLQQAQKMESVGRLAGGVAHDFNNLLTAITGYTELTLRKLNQSDPLRKNLEEVKKAAERASGLTRQLLAFSRKQVMQPKVIDLNAIISEMNRMLPRLIGEDIKIEKRLAADLGRIEADPGQIEQVIVNLVVNARDAMPQGGTLTVETSNVIMDEELVRKYVSVQPGAHILLAISDTGCGIDEETQRYIFEPFFTTKELGKGTGLGLSTVFGIVKQSKGSIWVNSEVGKGTTFCIYLPRVDAQVDAPEVKAALKKIAKGTGTVLLVEDDDLVRGIARTTLEMCGYKVLEAANGGEALLIIREHRCKIDLMLTDVIMPRMSGRTLVQEVASLCPEMKMLYMSGYTDDVIMPHGVFQEGLAFIHKPFTPEALSRKVREVLEG